VRRIAILPRGLRHGGNTSHDDADVVVARGIRPPVHPGSERDTDQAPRDPRAAPHGQRWPRPGHAPSTLRRQSSRITSSGERATPWRERPLRDSTPRVLAALTRPCSWRRTGILARLRVVRIARFPGRVVPTAPCAVGQGELSPAILPPGRAAGRTAIHPKGDAKIVAV
jgi:hypothetical protein